MDHLDLAREAVSIVRDCPYRPKTINGEPGGVVVLDKDCIPIIVGDIHAEIGNLIAVLRHQDNIKKINAGTHCLILLGDCIHNDQTGMMREMEGSLLSLEYLFNILIALNGTCIYIRGNHDTFDEQLVKSGIHQGREFRDFIVQKRGERYAEIIEDFFNVLPLFIIGKGFVATHAGPVRGGTTIEELVNIYDDENKVFQLLWNRINEYGGTPTRKEYDHNDIQATLKKLELPLETEFIVGHNPLWNDGNETGVWMNVLRVDHHHIIYSGGNTRAPYFTFESNKLILKFGLEPK